MDSKLMEKMQICMKTLEDSQFFLAFLTQTETPPLSEKILKALGTESSMQMVIYGLGNIGSNLDSQRQLSLALLMKRKFSWISNIEVFDPVITLEESRVLEALGCCLLNVDEKCRRQAPKPTLFFMPHCEEYLYGNLLEANWGIDMLNRIVLIGNPFTKYMRDWIRFSRLELPEKWEFIENCKQEYILAALSFTKEFEIGGTTKPLVSGFANTSWQFFNPISESELQLRKFSFSQLSG
ncbi:Protein SENSITIVITY TO RED LIGHT REDUCED 1 [Heracleum sosnowskyi]|uniref:Protein SENSITIVITY TO RED LIGHT REDUCED 1 n=1 Tax=Heracleum sosnowskyi TaxID=360622 RepID=A0AAD8J1D4_9APIA|nr:Protein SENSITIVITY TO RED LIGHT REDUCED 1 [Heracleum sosnowskyi]